MNQQLALELVGGDSQRWRRRKVRYRPPGEVFDRRFVHVAPIDEADARNFVVEHHYSGSYPAARFRTGIFVKRPFEKEVLGGVCVFSHSMSNAVTPKWLGVDDPRAGVELGRLVLLDHPVLAANAESFFVGASFRMLREALPEVQGVVAFCDPVARIDSTGRVRKPAHQGVVYRATNASYQGMSTPRTHLVAPDGWVASPRALSKIRNDESGAAYALRQLEAHGAPRRAAFEGGAAYIQRLRETGALRQERHPGCLAFTWQRSDSRR